MMRPLAFFLTAFALASCATSTPRATIVAPLTAQVSRGDEFHANVTSSDGRMSQAECHTLGVQIDRDVQVLSQPPVGPYHRYHAEVNITRYSRGNIFARTLLPGTGQIRMEGTVTLYQMPRHVPVGEFVINKSFALGGGFYGATVNIYAISDAFSKAVAKTLCNVR